MLIEHKHKCHKLNKCSRDKCKVKIINNLNIQILIYRHRVNRVK